MNAMQAAWFDTFGSAREVLRVGERPIPELATGNGEFVGAEYDEVALDTTHWMLYEAPEQVADLIAEWFV